MAKKEQTPEWILTLHRLAIRSSAAYKDAYNMIDTDLNRLESTTNQILLALDKQHDEEMHLMRQMNPHRKP